MAARVAIAIQSLPHGTSLVPTLTSVSAANIADGMTFVNTGQEILVIKNTEVGARTVTVVSRTDEGQYSKADDIVVTCPAAAGDIAGICVVGPVRTSGFSQSTGLVHVNFGAGTADLVKVAVVQLTY